MPKPSVGRIVHQVSYGTPGDEYGSECRAAVVTGVSHTPTDRTEEEYEYTLSLCVLNPSGIFFDTDCDYSSSRFGGSWHWPEQVK